MNFRPVRFFGIFLVSSVSAALLLLFVSRFMVLRVEQQSMSPTLAEGQWILVLKGADRVNEGDLAVFISPEDRNLAVKRCVLVGGNAPLVDHGWLITPWGRWFLTGPQWTRLDDQGIIPDGSVFLVGDNQFHSVDSRNYGAVPRVNLIGKVLLASGRRADG